MAWTATVLAGLSPVAPFNGTMVMSDSNCDRVSAVVVVALVTFARLRLDVFPAETPATATPATITARIPVSSTTLAVGLCPLNRPRPGGAELPLTTASLLVVPALWKSPVDLGNN